MEENSPLSDEEKLKDWKVAREEVAERLESADAFEKQMLETDLASWDQKIKDLEEEMGTTE